MTNEELRALLMRQQTGGGPRGQMSPNMQNQSAITPEMQRLANQDYAAKEAQLAEQMRVGQEMAFNADAPQGIQAGNVYVAPTWSASLADAVRRGIGGYEMGQARQGQEETEYNKGLSTEAQNQIAEIDRQEKLRQQQAEEAMAQTRLGYEGQRVGYEGTRVDQDAERLAFEREKEARQAADAAADRGRAWAGTKGEEYVNKDDANDTLVAILTPKGMLVDTATGEPIDQKQYKKAENTGAGGGYTSSTIKNIKRWANVDGNERTTFDMGDQTYDYDTREPVEPGWIKKNGFFEEQAVTGTGRNSALAKLTKDTENLRSLATDYTDMNDVLKKYDLDLSAGDEPLGRFEKDSGFAGKLTRAIEDASQPGAKTGEINSAIAAVLNAVIRNQAGMSQTVAEIERLTQQYGTNWMNDPKVYSTALQRLGPKISSDIGARVSALDSNTLDVYRNRLDKGGVPDWTKWGTAEDPGSTRGLAKATGRGQMGRDNSQKTAADYSDAELDSMTDDELEALLR